MTHSVPRFSQSWQGGGPPVHFVFRFLHASQAAEILALVCRFFAVVGLKGWLSLAGLIARAFGGEGIFGQWQHTSSDYRIIWGTNLTL